MRNLVLHAAISLDGYLARPDGSVDWLPSGPAEDFADFFAQFDTAIMGRKTYDIGLKLGGEANFTEDIEWYVFSRNAAASHSERVNWVTEPAAEFTQNLKSQTGKAIWLMGGGEIARTLLEARLVDRIDLAIVPVLLGGGIPMFPPEFPQHDLRFVETRANDPGLLRLVYECTK